MSKTLKEIIGEKEFELLFDFKGSCGLVNQGFVRDVV